MGLIAERNGEERICEVECRTTEITKSEQQRGNRLGEKLIEPLGNL